jgi:hypothetical protein
MGWQPTVEAGELAHGVRVVAAPVDSGGRRRDRWRGRVEEDAGWVDTRIEAVGDSPGLSLHDGVLGQE